ncbi:MAG: hypothetical protein NW241_07740 [Bacteroidia bacterium]|nr:hypothetical protein [Bacteroidia bacterium]
MQDALQRLPAHPAPDGCWQEIEPQLGELRRSTLLQALAALRQRREEAPAAVWSRIAARLRGPGQIRAWALAAALAALLAALPLYRYLRPQEPRQLSEREARNLLQLTPAQVDDYTQTLAGTERSLRQCLREHLAPAESAALLASLDSLSGPRDSLLARLRQGSPDTLTANRALRLEGAYLRKLDQLTRFCAAARQSSSAGSSVSGSSLKNPSSPTR